LEDKKEIMDKKYVICVDNWGMNYQLTLGKEYEVIKDIHESYVVKRDDDSIDKVSKKRFTSPRVKNK
jgi:hypothetical protein